MVRLFLLVVGLLVYGSLFPFRFDLARHYANPFAVLLHAWPAEMTRALWRDVTLNVAIYVPLGVTAFLAVAGRRARILGFTAAVLVGTALSACIEMVQLYDAYRSCSALDWLCNTVGAAAGAGLAMVLHPELQRTFPAKRRGAAPALLLVVCWAGHQLYPLIPQLTYTRLRGGLSHLNATPISWVEVLAGAAAWFVFALALRAAWGSVKPVWLALMMLAMPLRVVLTGRTLEYSELLGGVVAWILWVAIADAVRPTAGLLLLLTSVILRELAPFRFHGPPHAFSWMPFADAIDAALESSVAVFLRKAFEYGGLVWLLHARRVSYLTGGLALAIALGVMETMQCWMPGRQPETTDSALAIIMALMLWLLDREHLGKR